MSTWLLTGGAGYIGAHVIRSLQASGRDVVVLDDLSSGVAAKVPEGVPLIQESVLNTAAVTAALREHDVTGVVHLAAKKAVGESVEQPLYYYRENVDGMISLLDAMAQADVRGLVYSSSAAAYGSPATEFVAEDAPTVPESPYGETKVVGEWLTRDSARTRDLSWISLRYFNVAGAASDALGDTSVANLIPMVFRALSTGTAPQVFGDDYDTPDGSCIRDYIHVADLSAAHVAAARVVEVAHASAQIPVDPSAAVRSAGERVQHAAALAEHAATRLPGGSLAVGVASQGSAAAEVAAEVAGQAAARAIERVPTAARAVELAAHRLPWAIRSSTSSHGVRGQATELVAEVASQLGSLVARVAGVEESARLVDHLAVNIGTGRGSSVFEVIEALRESVGDPFAVDIVGRRPGDPPALVADASLAGQLLGWRARYGLADMTDSAWAAWQVRR